MARPVRTPHAAYPARPHWLDRLAEEIMDCLLPLAMFGIAFLTALVVLLAYGLWPRH